MLIIKIAFAWTFLFTIFLLLFRQRFIDLGNNKNKILNNKTKMYIFIIFTIPIIISTLYLSITTVSENIVSVTKGPVHWHADYEVWACGEKLDLIDPKFPRNKIGTPLLHEHNDDRIHVEGTVKNLESVSLSEYFKVIGGLLSEDNLTYQTNEKIVSYQNSQKCSDNSNGKIKVYVNGNKIDDYENYLIYPDSYAPPGDCIIIEFSSKESEETDRLCSSWKSKGLIYKEFKRKEKTIGEKMW